MTRIPSFGVNNPTAQPVYDPTQLWFYLNQLQAQQQQQQQQFDSGREDKRLQLLADILRQGQGVQNEARQANESRYGDILELFGVTRGRTMDGLADWGKSRQNDINRGFDTLHTEILNDMARRGMPGSTRRGALQTANQEARSRAINDADALRLDRVLGADERFTDKAAGVMERRTDAYPDLSGLGNIAQMLGQMETRTPPPQIPMPFPQVGPNQMGGGQMAPNQGGNSGGRFQSLPGTRPVAQLAAPGVSSEDSARAANIAQQQGQGADARRRALLELANRTYGGYSQTTSPGNQLALNQAVQTGALNTLPGQIAPTIPNAHPSVLQGGGGSPELSQLLQQLLSQFAPRSGGRQQNSTPQQQQQDNSGDTMQRLRRVINSRGQTKSRRATNTPLDFENYAYGVA